MDSLPLLVSVLFSHPISVGAFFYLPFWLSAIWFGYRLDPKEAWTIITIHWPLMVAIALFVYFPIYSSMEWELERKLRARDGVVISRE